MASRDRRSSPHNRLHAKASRAVRGRRCGRFPHRTGVKCPSRAGKALNCHGAIVASPLLRVRLGPEEVTPSVGRVPGSICARKSPGMQATDRPRSADRKERCGDELLDRYRRREYARRYKAEYTAGLTPQHLRSRIIAGGEKALIARLLREIDPAGSVLLDVPCGAG